MSTTTTHAAPTRTEQEVQQVLSSIAEGYGHLIRSPILTTPGDLGLEYETVSFPSMDGVPLEAWLMPCPGSDRLVIANHPVWFNRYGLPAHLEPWTSLGALGGNDFEVDFVPDYRVLHDAGYNVLAYDHRNLGLSGSANSGAGSGGLFEARDVVGSLQYARRHPALQGMTLGLFSRCQGANASMFAMERYPEHVEDVRCMVAPQPLSVRVTMERTLELLGIPERIDELEQQMRLLVSFTFDEMSPVGAARSVTVPTFLYQVHDDLLTRPSDVQAMFDNIPVADKKLVWIEGTTARWDGYLHFQREPEQMLEWFDTHMR